MLLGASQLFVMVDYVMEMTVKKSGKFGADGLVENFAFLVSV